MEPRRAARNAPQSRRRRFRACLAGRALRADAATGPAAVADQQRRRRSNNGRARGAAHKRRREPKMILWESRAHLARPGAPLSSTFCMDVTWRPLCLLLNRFLSTRVHGSDSAPWTRRAWQPPPPPLRRSPCAGTREAPAASQTSAPRASQNKSRDFGYTRWGKGRKCCCVRVEKKEKGGSTIWRRRPWQGVVLAETRPWPRPLTDIRPTEWDRRGAAGRGEQKDHSPNRRQQR